MNQIRKLIWGKEEKKNTIKNQSVAGECNELDSSPCKSREAMHSLQWQLDKVLRNAVMTSSNIQ